MDEEPLRGNAIANSHLVLFISFIYFLFEFLDCGNCTKYLSLLVILLSIHSYFDRAVLNSLLTLPKVRAGLHRFAEAVINAPLPLADRVYWTTPV